MMSYKFKSGCDVAVTYGWNRVAYNMSRALAASGLAVAAGDASSVSMTRASRSCDVYFKYRSFYRDPLGFVEDLESNLLRFKPKVYLPSHEETFIVSKYADRLRRTGVKIPVPDFAALRTLHKKDLLAIKAKEYAIPIPKTYRFESLQDLDGIWREIADSGAVIKMLNGNSAKGVFYAKSFQELYNLCVMLISGLEKQNYPLIQEYVAGDGYGVSMLFNHGKLRAKFTHKRLREKLLTGGTSTVRISTENSELEEYAERLLSAMKWHGVAMVEFKYNEALRRAWLIEVNPRFWGSLALAISSGVNFPVLLYKMAVDGDVQAVFDYKKNCISRWLLGDALAALDCLSRRKKVFNIFEYTGRDISYDDFYSDDPMPFFVQCAYYGAKFLNGFKFNPVKDSVLDIDNI